MIKLKKLPSALRASLAKMNPPAADHRVPGVLSFKPAAAGEDTAELLIYGNIGDSWWDDSVTAKEVVEQLRDNTAARILVRINSYGGSVTDGIAIYNELRAQAKKGIAIDGQVDAIAASIASLIAMACDNLAMPETAQMMLHAPWGGVWGNAKEMREYATVLDGYGSAMALAYARKTGKAASEFESMWADGTDHYYNAAEAVEFGLADEVSDGEDDEADDDAVAHAAAVADAALQRLIARAPQQAIGALFAASRHAPALPAAARSELTVQVDAAGVREAVAEALRDINPNPPADPAATLPADAGSNPPGDTPMTDEEKKAAAKAALAADKQRRDAIRSQFAPFVARSDLDGTALSALQRECEDDADVTAEQAGQKLLAVLGKDTTPSGGSNPLDGVDSTDVKAYREGAIQAVLHRVDPSANKLDEKSQDFRGFDLGDMARDCVERAGHRTRGMSKQEIAVRALQTTSDFPNILENVITKTLRKGYESAARTFKPFSRQATLPDFKQISRAQIGGAPSLKRVLEGAEYEHGTIGDGAEKYAVQKYGRIVAISWETVINDDLDALTRIPQAFGASAAELESDIVYAILTGNPNMADGTALFHADHGNLGTAAKLADALDPTKANPIAEMRKLMTLQKGLEGQYITVRPRYLVVPPSLEEAALKITSANFVASKGVDQNVFGPSLIPVSEPRLEDASSTAWFGAAEPNTIDTIEYAYLEGHEGVFTETKHGFEVDGVQVKCRHVFGAKAIDWRGLFKNAGL